MGLRLKMTSIYNLEPIYISTNHTPTEIQQINIENVDVEQDEPIDFPQRTYVIVALWMTIIYWVFCLFDIIMYFGDNKTHNTILMLVSISISSISIGIYVLAILNNSYTKKICVHNILYNLILSCMIVVKLIICPPEHLVVFHYVCVVFAPIIPVTLFILSSHILRSSFIS